MLKLTTKQLPAVLKDLPDPPKQLYVLGDLKPLLDRPKLAVVGSRKATAYGQLATKSLISEIISHGLVIVSGLALGIDAAAHRAALDNGGQTIAVLPCGLDRIYPAWHKRLAESILDQGGAIISEYDPGTPPLKHLFIARNRLVSGLSDGVLITEAAAKSGTLHTANFALDQGKPVMAVPGNINNPQSQGTNNLLKSGATLVTSGADILQALNLETSATNKKAVAQSVEEALILDNLANGVTEASELLELSGLDTSLFNQTLTLLEISGKIRPLGAGHWAIR